MRAVNIKLRIKKQNVKLRLRIYTDCGTDSSNDTEILSFSSHLPTKCYNPRRIFNLNIIITLGDMVDTNDNELK